MTALAVLLGGGLGAAARYLIDSAVRRRTSGRFPYGTLLVNALACLALGLVAGAFAAGHVGARTEYLLGTGVCGGMSTFSTFAVEAVELAGRRRLLATATYLVASLLLGIAAVAGGYQITR